MQPALKSSLLTILYILSVLTIVSSVNIPVPVESAGVCDPNDCNGAFSDTGDYLSYKCSGSSKRGLLTRDTVSFRASSSNKRRSTLSAYLGFDREERHTTAKRPQSGAAQHKLQELRQDQEGEGQVQRQLRPGEQQRL